MKTKIYIVIINIMLFWIVSDILTGITIKEGILGYVICGGFLGIAMLTVIPLIKFFTLPIKFITIIIISLMVSIIAFFAMNFTLPFVSFTDGTITFLANRYFTVNGIELGMTSNIVIGSLVAGFLSATLETLRKQTSKY